jgi:hypothetical protein
MRKIKLGLCFLDEDDNIVVKRFLQVHWEFDMEKDAKILLNVNMKDEVAAIITQQIKIDLDKGVVRKMIDEIGELEE